MISERLFTILMIAMVSISVAAVSCTAQQLGTYSISANKIFVAGISSGGFMVVQMHVAFSHTFKGAAVYAGGPYYCAEDSLGVALTTCLDDVPPVPLATLESTTAQWSAQRLIDPISNLQGQPVYMWSGKAHTTVVQPVMDSLRAYYQ